MTTAQSTPAHAPTSILLFVAAVSLLALSILHYGSPSGALAFGLALGTHLTLLRRQHAPTSWSATLLAIYVLAFTLALFFCPPIRVRQASRAWLPPHAFSVAIRDIVDPAPLRPGDLVAFRPAIPNAPLTLGHVVALEHQRVTIHNTLLRIDDSPVPIAPALARLLASAAPFNLDRLLVPGEVAIIPANLAADLLGPGDNHRLSFDLPNVLIVPRTHILGRIWRQSPRPHPFLFTSSPRHQPSSSTLASSPCQGT